MLGFAELTVETNNTQNEISTLRTRIDEIERRNANTPADQAELTNLTSQLNNLVARVDQIRNDIEREKERQQQNYIDDFNAACVDGNIGLAITKFKVDY